MWRSKVLND
uniref:Uncharacterized protein n=1 Tax=Rhizophora mucronata TaxID=61149 RepID=A0A2P2Q8J1_RHIMU